MTGAMQPRRPHSIRLALACACLLLAACQRSVADCPKSPLAIAQEMVVQFSGNTLSADSAALILGERDRPIRTGDYWQLASAGCAVELVFPAKDSAAPLPEAELRLLPGARLLLRDLESRFGPGETVFTSKTSSVLFRIPATGSDAPVLVFARLLAGQPIPDSAVQTLVLRRDPVVK